MSVELHLPDLPEVPISVGAPPAALSPSRPQRPPLATRLRESLAAYLPLLLMALLALATWWLVKNSPHPAGPAEERPVSAAPDYTMNQFAIERFTAAGTLKLRVEGEQLRHYPATDRIEIDLARFRAVAPDGRVTLAHARQAVGNGDGSEVQLMGGAEVVSSDAAGVPLLMEGEFLHAFLVTERVRSHVPVVVTMGDGTRLTAGGLDYDHATRRLELKGRIRTELPARTANGAKGARR